MSTRHTPGPWVADAFFCYGFPSQFTPNITINPVVLGRPINMPIAKVLRGGNEHAANARMIAAAPDLLAALKKMVNGPKYGPTNASADDWTYARAAIIKAEGGTA